MIETRSSSAGEGPAEELPRAAFGSRPGTWPLPTATNPHQLWLRAVAAGGQGRYGCAYADLALLRSQVTAGRLASLAHSTHGSFLRQLGWHTLARGWDGRALALAGEDPEARADALVGLAADALGVGHFAAAATLLTRADAALADAVQPGLLPALTTDRLAVRRRWVGAELAMACGDGATAVGRRPRKRSGWRTPCIPAPEPSYGTGSRARWCWRRPCAAPGPSTGPRSRRAGVEGSGQLGLIPLRWALACLLIDIGNVTVDAQGMREVTEVRDICAGEVQRAGGTWRTAEILSGHKYRPASWPGLCPCCDSENPRR